MRRGIRVVLTLLMVALAVLAATWLWRYYMLSPWTRDARIHADIVSLASDVSGRVVDLQVRDNQQVEQGQLLFRIDPERFEVALEQALALEQTRLQQMRLREHEASRREALGTRAISAEARENAAINAAIARADYRQAQAMVREARLDLARSEVRAPRAGQVTNLRLVQGNHVQAGQAALALVVADSFHVQAYFEETKLPFIKQGDPVWITLMSGGSVLRGEVESISLGITDRNSAPDGQLLADVEPTFDWVRLAQRIPVRIRLLESPGDITLASGLSASVRVVTR